MNIKDKFVSVVNDSFVKCLLCDYTIPMIPNEPVTLSRDIADHLYCHVSGCGGDFLFVALGYVYIRRLYSGTGYNANAHYISMMFPMLLFLLPVNAHEFVQRSRDVMRDCLNEFDECMSDLMMKTNYMCVKCRNYYESGLPSLDVVSRHVRNCIQK